MIKIDKPKFDLRDFVGGTLDNNIKYVFIKDPTLEKSFVTVAVNIGSYSNPKDYDGLAHFLEHMLFMGSKKYPDEKYYFEELNKLGGYSNAYTDSMETVYYFTVFDDGLAKIFDIFSRFFIDPLFAEDSVQREIKAVNSEHKKNINSDMWRKHQFTIDLMNKDSGLNNFGTGSLNTLDKKDIREKLIEFYNKYYTSNNISICIASSKSFEELKSIIDTSFGLIKKNDKHNKLKIIKPLYSENKLNSYHLKTLSNIYNISYIFEIPKQKKYLKSKYFSIFEMILLNKSENSIYFYLSNMGYLNSINIDINYEGVFEITLMLTNNGLNNIGEIEAILFNTIEQIINSNINNYALYFQKILEINFDTLNKFEITDLCNLLAVNHFYYETNQVFKSNFIIRKIKSNKKYKQTFIKYLNKDNIIRIITSQKYPFSKKLAYIKTREYKAEYSLIKITPNSSNKIINNQFDTNNQYHNIHPKLIERLDIYDTPKQIYNNVWYGACSKFGEPLVNILLQINNSKYFESASNYVLTQISCWVLNYLINIIMYKAFELSNSITFSPIPSTSSININITALNDEINLKLLLTDLKDFLFNLDLNKLSEDYIKNLIISIKESYKNISFRNPSEYSLNKIKSYIFDTEYPNEQLISVTETLDFNKIKNYLKSLLDESIITSFIYGNIEQKSIPDLLEPYNKYFINSGLIIPITHEIQEIIITHPNINEKSNCVTLYYYIGELNIRKEKDALKNIKAIIGIRILSQDFFDELRTKKQLGYLVNMSMSSYRNKYYITQKIQSDKSVEEIIKNINEFNTKIKKYLKESEFDNFKNSIKKELLEPDYSLSDKVNKYSPEITSHEYIFNRHILLYDQVDNILLENVIDYFDEILLKPIRVIVNGN